MNTKQHIILAAIGLVSLLALSKLALESAMLTRAQGPAPATATPTPTHIPENPVVVHVKYAEDPATPAEAKANLNELAGWLDVWRVDPDTRTLTALVWPDEYAALLEAGYQVEIDTQETMWILEPPGYPCYRTVEGLYATLAQTVTVNYPGITYLVDYGNSWEKVTPGGEDGYDLFALEITNQAIPGSKPVAVMDGGMHSREMTPPEIAMALIDYLTTNYNHDADVTWLVDHHKIVILPMVNPDGHKKAEIGLAWRKNTDNDDGCSDPGRWGTDLNRNFYFKWGCCGGSSPNPCNATYRGPSPDSEPEVAFYQSYVRGQIPDQWDYSDTSPLPAPLATTGILVNMHSADQSILYPWGWTDADAPNDAGLKAIAQKYSSLSGYSAKRSLYQVDGILRDWGYGELGIPSFTVEAGTIMLQDCDDLPAVLDENLPALLYMIRIARAPYMLIHGPDVLAPTLAPASTVTDPPVHLNATVSDVNNGGQAVAAVVYYVDVPPWVTTTTPVSYPMTALDGAFDEPVEAVRAELDIHGLSSGRHTIFVQGQDANGNWGPLWAAWLTVSQAWIQGSVVDDQTEAPISAADLTLVSHPWTYTTQTGSSGRFAQEVLSGTYTITATARNYHPTAIEGVTAQSGITTTLRISLTRTASLDLYLPIIKHRD